MITFTNFAIAYNAARAATSMSRCAALRHVARYWDSTRKDFIDQAYAYGVHSDTAATQWQRGRKTRNPA